MDSLSNNLRIVSIDKNIVDYFRGCTEILTNIFQNLSLYDRKNVRLSCQSFYDACNEVPILGQEKFVIRCIHSNQEIVKTLLGCERIRLNLEIHGMKSFSLPVKVLKHCGSRIQSLLFYTSQTNHEMIENIFLYCINLQYLRLCLTDVLDFFTTNSATPFAKLRQNGSSVVRNCLETFEVQFQGIQDWTSVIENILDIHPNIKTFDACNRPYCNNIRFSSARLAEFLKSSALERLRCLLFIDDGWLKNMSTLLRNLRLKEIRLRFSYSETIFSSLMEFFSHQNHLEIIYLQYGYPMADNLLKQLFLYLIKMFSNLRRIRIHYEHCDYGGLGRSRTRFVLNYEEFGLVLSKQLEFLDVPFTVESIPAKILNLFPTVPLNTTLNTLILKEMDAWISIIFLEHFQNLYVLHINEVTDEVLQTILRNQVNLEVLHISQLNLRRSFGVSNNNENYPSVTKTLSIKRLRNLKSLKIEGVYLERFPKDCIPEFVFPKLKEFGFHCMNNIVPGRLMDIATEWMDTVARNSPELEIIEFSPPISAFIRHVLGEKFQSKLKKLHTIASSWSVNLERWFPYLTESFFVNESLRNVIIGEEMYCFNRFKKELYKLPKSIPN